MSTKYEFPIGYQEICEIIPHRYPFLLVDRVTGFSDREWIEGFKNLTCNESFFEGHFPGRPIMPGVLTLEALAQIGAIFAKLSTSGSGDGKLIVFTGMDDVRFRKPVTPGDVLGLRMELIKAKFRHWRMKGTATVNGEVVVEGILMAAEL